MGKTIDLTNLRFGEWLVLRQATAEEKKNRSGAYWLCKCSCGTERIVNGQSLRNKTSLSCGCKTSYYLSLGHQDKNCIDITGNQYGELTVLGRDKIEEEKHNKHDTYWRCKCSCGNEISVIKDSLMNGRTRSCGCLRKKVAASQMSKISASRFIDETGNKYGKLTVIQKDSSVPNRGVYWLCKCDCGNFITVSGRSLRAGNTQSCGCLGKSRGEYYINNLLSQNVVSYSKEYQIKINNHNFRFDFAITDGLKLLYLIEFDGKQHYKPVPYFGGEEYYQYICNNDMIKNQWCKDNNIPLIRIPYTHLDKLTIEDLKLETTTFLVR